MRVALVYDRLNKQGGAEVILQEFAKLYPDAYWYTSVWEPKNTPFTKGWRVHPSFLNHFPYLRSHHELVPFLMPFAFESFDLTAYDLVISVGSAESKGIITKPNTLHLHYCLTPTRYLYQDASLHLRSPLARWVGSLLRRWDQMAAQRPDFMIAISEQVKKRVKKYYNRDVSVIYPPVATAHFRPGKTEDYYLTVSRLVRYKRLDLLVKAFNASGRKLVIVGEGLDRVYLQRQAKPNITFVGRVAEEDLVKYYGSCRAYVAAQTEDFGIAFVEAQASGKPVVAYRQGGAGEVVQDKVTGLLYDTQTPEAINRALDEFETMKFEAVACRKNAARFDRAVWQKLMAERIKEAWEKR